MLNALAILISLWFGERLAKDIEVLFLMTSATPLLLFVLLFALSATMAFAMSPAPMPHPPIWTIDLDTNPYTVWTTLSNDYALYSIVNNTVKAYHPNTGSVIWTTTISDVFVVIVAAVNNKWLIAETGIDIYVISAATGSIVSHTQNETYANSITPTQFDDVFFTNDNGGTLRLEQVMADGVLQRLPWNSTSFSSFAIVPETPYFYVLDDSSVTNPTLTFTNMKDWSSFVVNNVSTVSSTPIYGRVAVVLMSGEVSMIDVPKGAVVWSNTLLEPQLSEAVTIILIQTSGSVFAVSTFLAAMSPMFVMNAETGELLGNHSNSAGVWAYTPQAVTVAAGRIVLIARKTADTGTTSYVVSLDPTNGNELSSTFTPTLATQLVLPIGGGRVVVPNGQGFATFSGADATTALTYNLNSPGVTAVASFVSPVSADIFVLFDGTGFSAFANSP
ncbi:GPI-anchored surface protein, putative [Bodo saltans]|uniref:GPI-anchored surface protein, putative n=1 Tax=Bodo saltans TaxID=75058 RepID=A0A0S4J1N2_BODSA|nr:GPI-anchored surface protein, putative [Bodo saltans]|eukprot:CUG51915.1 GPI-anchored surface protein, putative [Bodo saltans]